MVTTGKKRSERRKQAEPKTSARRRRPGGAGRPEFNQLEINIRYRPSLVKVDARNFELSW